MPLLMIRCPNTGREVSALVGAQIAHPQRLRQQRVGGAAIVGLHERTCEIKCSGLNLAADSFASLPDKLVTSSCPVCALDHTWLKCDARFVDGELPDPCESSDLL